MEQLKHSFTPEQVQRFMKFLSWKQKTNQRKLRYLNFVNVLNDQFEVVPYIGSNAQKQGYLDSLEELRNMIMLKVVKFDAAIETIKNDPIIAAALVHYENTLNKIQKGFENGIR